jgi:hypothetical protein
MTDDDAKDAIDYLRACGLASISRGSMWDVEMCTKTVATIERLTADVARLTPKPMTVAEAAKVMRDHEYSNVNDWGVTDDVEYGRCVYSASRFHPERQAVYIAQGLLRDAGPIVEKGSLDV